MPNWQIATALSISLLVGLTTHVFYRRPPRGLWPSLPLVFGTALLFSAGDLIANQWTQNDTLQWTGMVMVYTGLLTIGPCWWVVTRNFSRISGYSSGPSRHSVRPLLVVNGLLWLGLITNPWHGQFLEIHAGARSSYGPLWYCTASINYLVLLTTMAIHARAALQLEDPVIRSQCRYLVAAIGLPIGLNMVYVFSPEPLAYDPTSLGFALSCTLFLFAVERRELFVLERVSLPAVLDNDADAVLIVTAHHRLLFANPPATELFGPEAIEGGSSVASLLETIAPTFSLPEPSEDVHSIRGQEHRFRLADGREAWIIVDISPVQQSRGTQAGLCLRFRDQTALRDAKREAERRLVLLEGLSLASGEGLLVRESTGEIRYINAPFARLWNLPLETLQGWGQDLWAQLEARLTHPFPESLKRVWSPTGVLRDTSSRISEDLALLDGRILEVETFPIPTEDQAETRAWRVADVSFARAESRALIQTQKLEGLGVLAGGIAHDFNNLLVAILGNTEIARSELGPGSTARSSLDDVEAAAVRASELTGQLLAYAGKTTYSQEVLDLSELVREVTELITVSVHKDIRIVFHLASGLPPIRGGAVELRQVVMNLITNAADAIGEGPGTITIETGVGAGPILPEADVFGQHGALPDDPVFLRITDDGIGMDRRTLDKIFDPFFTTKFTGRGLGLAATRGILDSHHGSLRIETALGVGTSFRVALPSKPALQQHPGAARAGQGCADATGQKILVVDDEPSVRSVLEKSLRKAGYDVVTCDSGDAAVSLMQGEAPHIDLAILDITMPGIDGLETRSLLRELLPELPIVLSSGYPEDVLETLRSADPKRDAFIQKPYTRAALRAQLRRMLATPPESPAECPQPSWQAAVKRSS